MQRNRWTTVCNSRTTKGPYIVSGADKKDNQRRNKEVVRMLCLIDAYIICEHLRDVSLALPGNLWVAFPRQLPRPGTVKLLTHLN